LARPSPVAPPAESQTRRISSKRTTLTQCSAAPSVAPVCLEGRSSPRPSRRHPRGTKRASSRSSSRSSLRSTWSLMRSS
jgi:hypothetical protein